MSDIVLASKSEIRNVIMKNAGIEFIAKPASIDETSILAALVNENAKPADIVDTLAEYKAKKVSVKFPQALVIGCDQILVCENKVYEKSNSLNEAKEVLKNLRGKTHSLMAAIVIYENLQPVWRHTGKAQLTMRNFSDDFLESYLENNGNNILSSVGCYKLEENGIQLFSNIQGDYFTILGLPLLELLGYLRIRGKIDQ